MYREVLDQSGNIRTDVILKQEHTWVPNDPANRDWQEYQAWLAQGNQPEPADPIEPAE